MAHFYGRMEGARGAVTRCGAKTSGVHTTAASWDGCVDVQLYYDEHTRQDMASVWLKPWKGSGVSLRLYEGPVNPQPAGDIDAALRCRTCVNFNSWKSIAEEKDSGQKT